MEESLSAPAPPAAGGMPADGFPCVEPPPASPGWPPHAVLAAEVRTAYACGIRHIPERMALSVWPDALAQSRIPLAADNFREKRVC